METLTPPIQDYLKAIYDLSGDAGAATTNQLAARLAVAPASVTGMLQRLASSSPPLVRYRKHQGVNLTPSGKRAALEVIRHHRLLECYLVRALGYSWDNVHAEAERLEHVISEDFEARIAAALGNPERDPHGEPIPTPDLTMPADESRPLASLRPPQTATVERVRSGDPALLRHLQALGLTPGAHLRAVEFSEFDGNLSIQIGKREKLVVVGPSISNQIYVSR